MIDAENLRKQTNAVLEKMEESLSEDPLFNSICDGINGAAISGSYEYMFSITSTNSNGEVKYIESKDTIDSIIKVLRYNNYHIEIYQTFSLSGNTQVSLLDEIPIEPDLTTMFNNLTVTARW